MRTRPYQNNYTVDVIGHNHECVQLDVRVMFGQNQPIFFNNFFSLNILKNHFAIMRANGDKIRSLPRIVVPLQANGTAVKLRDRLHENRVQTPRTFETISSAIDFGTSA